jgi:2,5-diketo-D-gluconate reductase A
MSIEIPQFTLNNGVRMPILGFGVFQVPAEQTEQVVTDALAADYRHLDTAQVYGPLSNEELVGRALTPVREEPVREEIVIATEFG